MQLQGPGSPALCIFGLTSVGICGYHGLVIPESFVFWCSSINAESVSEFIFRIQGLDIIFVDLTDIGKAAPALLAGPDRSILVFSDEWDQRPAQCKSSVLSKLGVFSRRVNGRDCSVRMINPGEAKEFLKAYHLQGDNKLAVAFWGLFYKEEMLAVLSLGRHSRQISQNRIVLDRLCFKDGVQVLGGSSKLFKACAHWARECKYDEIVSFSDNRWSAGGVYEKIGFDLEKNYKPDYFYVKDGVRYSKQSQKKSASHCPESITEREWAEARGMVRLYDKGKKRWIFALNPGEHASWKHGLSERCATQHQNGIFRHSHVRGHFKSRKNDAEVYFGSSYELRCIFLLENDRGVKGYRRCEAFEAAGGWRNPDLWIDFSDGHSEIWEIKPKEMLVLPAVIQQIEDSRGYASARSAGFRVWTENDSGLDGERKIIAWAKEYLRAEQGDDYYLNKTRETNRRKRKVFYQKHIANNKIDVVCDYCHVTHTVLKMSYEKNVRKNGKYVCMWLGGHLSGKKPKLSLRKENPYLSDGKKECSCCRRVLELGAFHVRRASRDGLCATCKKCDSAKARIEYLKRTGRQFVDGDGI